MDGGTRNRYYIHIPFHVIAVIAFLSCIWLISETWRVNSNVTEITRLPVPSLYPDVRETRERGKRKEGYPLSVTFPTFPFPFYLLVSSPGRVIPRAGKKEVGMLDLP